MGSSQTKSTPVTEAKRATPVNIVAKLVSLKYTVTPIPIGDSRRLYVADAQANSSKQQPFVGIDEKRSDAQATYAMYDTDAFTDPYQLVELVRRHGGRGESVELRSTLEHLFARLCAGTRTKSCVNGQSKCMGLRSLDGNDGRCAEIAKEIDQSFVDGLKMKWCLENDDAADCACINRSRSKDYDALKDYVVTHENLFARDECWYKPCTSGGAMTLSGQEKNACSAKVCINSNAISSGKGINTGAISDVVQCFNRAHPCATTIRLRSAIDSTCTWSIST
ncbi:30.3 kDa Myristylated membrane protein-like [Spodoptera frugiperda ascovirus 1a]|uniref:30.3 kDa Myristylated membrane protein-like n=1 Tax=Spodoptera frugiperda ascovirus 1a TaxID=113370 RepID=Q0E547_SFAVA|nr:30.3 kDa Myristylated membrane protein-like [Spodoptera frugiperda ascovirus 1a]CAL44654.1 30.3 kDa Myristylated membrane protein-like [Spodoptera frugiperda ascovirus 1a]